ncbi:hypothetical protein RLW55_10855 [Hyphomicrobium sp. B1]|jgi:hypothetical protein|uniref:hypothetical protein n=1 Tax=unclassified Hyphomicrobium TaxID=2619925 RepID=UPI000213DB09|nr:MULTISPECIES: hypothetical protein [unclassified Hyphomicrobium]CCB66321.1 protein of unknown function [Hyphomicrobium sp. MC1]
MNTGVSGFEKLPEMSAIYPFHGDEILFTLAILAFFIAFFIFQISMEARHHKTIIGNFTASPAE